jgi:hypothetical protein
MGFLKFILSHSIFIAVCAAALALQTVQLLQLDADIFLYGFVFFATLSSYNFYWLLSKYNYGSVFYVAIFFKKEQWKIVLLIISFGATLLCYLQSQLYFYYVLFAVLLNLLYVVPLIQWRFLNFTRKAGFVKTILLATTWTYVTAFLPMQKAVEFIDKADVLMLVSRFLFMLLLCIIFDSRDIAIDKIRGFTSLATTLQPAILRNVVVTIIVLLMGINLVFTFNGITIYQSAGLQVALLATVAAYKFSAKKQGYLFYYFLIDGLMLFSAMATFIASI